jgi:hypothetical protein
MGNDVSKASYLVPLNLWVVSNKFAREVVDEFAYLLNVNALTS